MLEPRGPLRDDLRMARICEVMANCHRTKGRALKPADFMFKFGPARRMSAQEMMIRMKAFAMAHNRKLAERQRRLGVTD